MKVLVTGAAYHWRRVDNPLVEESVTLVALKPTMPSYAVMGA